MSDPILELLATPPHPSMSVDEHSVYAGGRRRLRRRTLRRTGFGVVGVVGAAAIAFGALGSGIDNDALPAGPSPSASSSGRVSAELLDGRYAVEVVLGAPADQPNVTFYAMKAGKRQQLAGSSVSADMVSMGTGSGAEGVMLGTAPASATNFLNVVRPGSGGLTMDQQPLPGTGYQAVAFDFGNAGDADGYIDTIWMDDSGEVRDARGTRLPSTKVSPKETFFISQESGQMGVFMPGGSTSKALGKGLSATLGYGEKPEVGSWTTTPVSSGGPRVTSVTWTDTAGTRHTDAVE